MTLTDTSAATMAYWFLDTLAIVHSPTSPLVIEVTIPPGGSPPLHVHHDLDDSSYLLEGVLAVRCGERTFRADPGAYLPQPSGVPHTFRVVSSQPARMLLVHADDSFLRLVRSIGVPAPSRTLPSDMAQVSLEKLERALEAVGVSVVGSSMTAAEAEAIALGSAASHLLPTDAGETNAVPDIAELHRLALDATARVVANVGPGHWAAPTPCDDWDVRALVSHLVSGNLWAAELASGKTIEDVGDRLDGDLLSADPRCAYGASAAAAVAAFAAPGALEAPCAVSYGPVPGAVYAGHRFLDVFIHGWDLAVATGQDTTLDPVLVEACHELVEPQADLLRASGAFGEHIEPPAASDAQARLLATLGRRA
jgi:uncharacterized protein (TIGR03086 family)